LKPAAQGKRMLSKLKNKIEIILFIGIALLACLLMTGATKKLPTLPKTEKILWTGYWDTGEWKDKGPYEYYCVVSEKGYMRTLRIYKPTPKGYKKIYTYSDGDYFIKAYPDVLVYSYALNTYWEGGSARVYRLFECNPKTDEIKMTFEIAFKNEPERLYEDNWDAYLIMGDEDSSFWTYGGTLSYETALFYKRVTGKGYSEFTTCKWDDRYLMMDSISKQ
jgi:hypothetical protein